MAYNGGIFDYNGNGKLDSTDYFLSSQINKFGSGGNGGGGCASCLAAIMLIGIVMIFFSIFK